MEANTEAARAVVRWSAAAPESVELREGVLDRLARVIGYDGAFFATVDPATLLYTSGVRRHMPPEASAAFIRTEFAMDDVNQLRDLAAAASPAGRLDDATSGDRRASVRYREAMEPFGLGDELRVALRVDGLCWGLLCLHRADAPSGFGRGDADLLARLSPHLAAGLRRTAVLGQLTAEAAAEGPGVALVAADGSVEATTPAAARWLAELAESDAVADRLPTVVVAVIERLHAVQASGAPEALPPRARVRTRSGQWLVIHASTLDTPSADRVAVVIEPASAAVLAPLVVAAYSLTPRETEVVQALLAGRSRKAISALLRISHHTVNDHVKAIFDKTGVSSVGALRAHVFAEHFSPGR